MTLSELREIARRRGIQVDEGVLELLAEVLSFRASEFERLWSRIDERLRQEREYQERYFSLLREMIGERFEAIEKRFEAIERRFEAVEKRFELVERQLRELREDLNQRLTEQVSHLNQRLVEQQA
ncbi:MAG: hypothetical protein RMJ57_06860, partial [Bacteroidia bacterium]|nr:hypothetical protein [Bacteroidia bacterium]